MRSATAFFLAVAAVVSQVSATIFVTDPVGSTTCTAGEVCTVVWDDDGTAPLLSTIGTCSIDLCTGGQQQQTCLQNISPSTNVSQILNATFTPLATDGPDGAVYFIKFSSLGYKDPSNPNFAYTSFSAKFTLAGMTGTFNSTVEAEISGAATGASSTGVVASTPASTPAAATTSATMAKVTSSSVVTVTKVSSSSVPTTSAKAKSGAITVTVPGVVSSITGMTFFAGFASLFLGMLAFGL